MELLDDEELLELVTLKAVLDELLELLELEELVVKDSAVELLEEDVLPELELLEDELLLDERLELDEELLELVTD